MGGGGGWQDGYTAAVSRTCISYIHYLEMMQIHVRTTEVAKGKAQLLYSIIAYN